VFCNNYELSSRST